VGQARRIAEHGNPRFYSCFTDETLNVLLRTCAAYAHRANLEYRVLTMFNMQGVFRMSEFLFGS